MAVWDVRFWPDLQNNTVTTTKDGGCGQDVTVSPPLNWAGGKPRALIVNTYGATGWKGYLSFEAQFSGRRRARVEVRVKDEPLQTNASAIPPA